MTHLTTPRRTVIGGAEYWVPTCYDCKWEGQPCTTRSDAAKVKCAVYEAIQEGWRNRARRRDVATA